jgi:hypothetical protein
VPRPPRQTRRLPPSAADEAPPALRGRRGPSRARVRRPDPPIRLRSGRLQVANSPAASKRVAKGDFATSLPTPGPGTSRSQPPGARMSTRSQPPGARATTRSQPPGAWVITGSQSAGARVAGARVRWWSPGAKEAPKPTRELAAADLRRVGGLLGPQTAKRQQRVRTRGGFGVLLAPNLPHVWGAVISWRIGVSFRGRDSAAPPCVWARNALRRWGFRTPFRSGSQSFSLLTYSGDQTQRVGCVRLGHEQVSEALGIPD